MKILKLMMALKNSSECAKSLLVGRLKWSLGQKSKPWPLNMMSVQIKPIRGHSQVRNCNTQNKSP